MVSHLKPAARHPMGATQTGDATHVAPLHTAPAASVGDAVVTPQHLPLVRTASEPPRPTRLTDALDAVEQAGALHPKALSTRTLRVAVEPESPLTLRAPEDYAILEEADLPPVPADLWGSVNLDKPWVTYDLETTSLLGGGPRVLEIGCVVTHVDASRRSFTSLVRPDIDFAGAASIKIHRITPAHVMHASVPTLAEVTRHLAHFLAVEAPEGYVLGGFNTQGFDNAVMREDLRRQKAPCPFGRVPELDMKTAFRSEAPPQDSGDRRTLKAAVERFCHRGQWLAHGAKSDAVDASDVLFGLAREFGTPDMTLSDWVKRYENIKPSRFRFVLFDDALWSDGTAA